MLVINNRVFLPQERSRSVSYEEKMNDTKRRSSIDFNVSGIQNYNEILDNCRTLGDAIHEPELFIEKDHCMDFLCVICQCICSTPMDIGCKNGHIYCKQCLNSFFATQSNGQCPQCSDNVSRYATRINHFALRLLLKLRIFCPFSTIMCHNENECKQYECEWIGCYSDIIEHLSDKCKYGTFITNTSIQRIRIKYEHHDINSKYTDDSTINDDMWKISRAEITSYRVFWEQICDNNKQNHVNKKTVQENVFNLTQNEIKKLWFIVGADEIMTENQFYAALHIARQHNNKYQTQCDLHTLYSLPACLSTSSVNKVRYNLNMSAKEKAKAKATNDRHKEINLETRIGTMQQLKIIAGINVKRKRKQKEKRNDTVSNDIDLNINNLQIDKQHIDEYKKWFMKADVNKDGYIDGVEGRNFFIKSKLSPAALGKIWCAVDHERCGKLSEAQFYAFFHIVMTLKKTCGQLSESFSLPACLEKDNILNIMKAQHRNRTTTKDDVEWINNVFLSNTMKQSSSNILDSLPDYHNNSNSDANNNHVRSDSIDSVHDWGDFNFDF